MPPKRKAKAEPAPRGPKAGALGDGVRPATVERLAEAIEADGGSVLAVYRDPLGGHWQILAGLPLDRVEPTPYQRDLSEIARMLAAARRLDGSKIRPDQVARSGGAAEE